MNSVILCHYDAERTIATRQHATQNTCDADDTGGQWTVANERRWAFVRAVICSRIDSADVHVQFHMSAEPKSWRIVHTHKYGASFDCNVHFFALCHTIYVGNHGNISATQRPL